MRKLLLATAAVLGLGVGVAEEAVAQTFPTPGQVTVRLNGRVRVYAGLYFDRDLDSNFPAAASTATGGAGGTIAPAAQGINKQSNFSIENYARLYPGFDGVTANGLKYGASLEIRQDQNSGAGGGIYGGISQQTRARNSLYFRREWGYLGTDRLGTLRFGMVDGPTSLFMTGNFENFDAGGWNGDLPGFLAGNAQLVWPFGDVGNLYTTNKVTYLSPQFAGFDFGVSFAPTSASGGEANAEGCGGNQNINAFIAPNTSAASPGCDRLSSTSTGDNSRPRNIFEGQLRYRGTFGPLGVAGTAGYIGSGRVNGVGGIANNGTIVPAPTFNYNGYSVGDFGLALTYGGLSFGGKYQFGTLNGQWGLAGTGFIDAAHAGNPLYRREAAQSKAWLIGASYTMGPLIFGAHYIDYTSEGSLSAPGTRREQGIAAGATYSLAPGVAIFLSYLWDSRKESGADLAGTGTVAAAATNAAIIAGGGKPKITAQAIGIGTGFAW